jgi:hypothetical protein
MQGIAAGQIKHVTKHDVSIRRMGLLYLIMDLNVACDARELSDG